MLLGGARYHFNAFVLLQHSKHTNLYLSFSISSLTAAGLHQKARTKFKNKIKDYPNG